MKWFLQVKENYLDLQEVKYEQPIVWWVEKKGESESARGTRWYRILCAKMGSVTCTGYTKHAL